MIPGRSLKSFRLLLLPLSFLYWVGISIRNWFYNNKILRSASFGLPLICVGNLAVGGTGKSPMVEYLLALLKNRYKVATLSRGYKRRTRGYALANESSTALEIGDEPMQFHLKFPEVPVAVGEERVAAVPQLLHDRPDTEVIILDDAFQHRSIRAGLNIVLTDYSNLFTSDTYLPAGSLRDLKKNYKRAEILIVTKCPDDLEEKEANEIREAIKPTAAQQLYFTSLEYRQPYQILDNNSKISIQKDLNVLVLTGIANPRPLVRFVEERAGRFELLDFRDHHIFTIDDLKLIKKKWVTIAGDRKIILTTEKDAVRLVKFKEELSGLPLYVLPVRHQFLFGRGPDFEKRLITFIDQFKPEA